MLVDIFMWIVIVLMVFWLRMVIRLHMASYERDRIWKIVLDLMDEDIERGIEWKPRFDDYWSVSFDSMVFKIWKPVKSFYRNKDCIKPYKD